MVLQNFLMIMILKIYWLKWHLEILSNAMNIANANIRYIIQKTKFLSVV